MNTRYFSRWFWLALAVACLTVPFFANKAAANRSATRLQGGTATATTDFKFAGGLTVLTFTVSAGAIKMNFPDDMRAGDTISGTVIPEPKGKTEEERNRNSDVLNGYVVQIQGQNFPVNKGNVGPIVIPPSPRPTGPGIPPSLDSFFDVFVAVDGLGPRLGPARIPLTQSGAVITPDPKITPPGMTPSGAFITPDPKITPAFVIPPLGQTGRPIVITGPFDGDRSTTVLNFFQAHSQAPLIHQVDPVYEKEFLRNTVILAESPRKAVFEVPTNVTGPIEIKLKEGDVETKGTHRNVGVDLTAPKTSLLKGESTELRVQVNGLEGIKTPIPLTLECKGVITMTGGNYQPLTIQPSQVGADGSYSTTRRITGVQAGGWGATATVVTHRFDVCLQDDSTREFVLVWNTFNGDYIFTNPFPPTKPSGQPPQTGSTSPTSLPGKGTMIMKGCILTLQHNAPDRRVFATLDTCKSAGSASVEIPANKEKFTITDRNTADNTCPSQ